jgi:hypothetical protein
MSDSIVRTWQKSLYEGRHRPEFNISAVFCFVGICPNDSKDIGSRKISLINRSKLSSVARDVDGALERTEGALSSSKFSSVARDVGAMEWTEGALSRNL